MGGGELETNSVARGYGNVEAEIDEGCGQGLDGKGRKGILVFNAERFGQAKRNLDMK